MYGTVPSNTSEPPSVQVTEFEGTQLLGQQSASHSCQRVVFILLLTTILLTTLGAALYALFSVHPHAATPPIVFHEPKYQEMFVVLQYQKLVIVQELRSV